MVKAKIILSKYLDLLLIIFIGRFTTELIISFGSTSINYYSIITLLIWLISDLLFKNASLFKRLFNLKILKLNGEMPKKWELIIRNALSFGVIDIIIILICGRTIGDFLLRTQVVTDVNSKIVKYHSQHSKIKAFVVGCFAILISFVYYSLNNVIAKMYENQSYKNFNLDIPVGCNLDYIYEENFNLIFYKKKTYKKYLCNNNINLNSWKEDIFINGENKEIEDRIIELIEKNFYHIKLNYRLSFDDDYSYYYINDNSYMYVIKFNQKKEIYIIEVMKKND